MDILQLVEDVLVYEQFTVKGMLSSDNAVVAMAYSVDLFLFDYRLTEGNGGDLRRQFKSIPELKHIPTIIFSAYMHKNIDFKEFGCDALMNWWIR